MIWILEGLNAPQKTTEVLDAEQLDRMKALEEAVNLDLAEGQRALIWQEFSCRGDCTFIPADLCKRK